MSVDATTPPDRRRWYEWALLVAGWSVIVIGALGAVGRISHFAGDVPWTRLALWCVALAATHDLLVGPTIGGLALVVSRVLPWPARGAVAAATIVSALVVAVSYARIRAYGADAGEPSLLAGSATADVGRVVLVVWAVAAATAVVATVRSRSPRPG